MTAMSLKMSLKLSSTLLLGALALSAGACSGSMGATGDDQFSQTYAAEFETVVQAAAEAIRSLGMGMEVEAEGSVDASDDSYSILAYKERRMHMGRHGQRNLRAVSLHVDIERLEAGQTHVRITVPGREVASYGELREESPQAAREYAERVLRELEDRL